MNRDKRKYLLKLLRRQQNPFVNMIDPVTGVRRVIDFDKFVGEELRVQVDAMLLDSTPRAFSVRYPAQAIGQHVLGPILKDLEVTFAATKVPSEHVRRMAAATLKEMFGESDNNIEVLKRVMADKHTDSPLEWHHGLFVPAHNPLLPNPAEIDEAEAAKRRAQVLAMAKEAIDETPDSKETFVDKTRQALKQRRDAIHTPAPAIDSCGLDLCISKDAIEKINRLVNAEGLARVFDYRPMPAKPADYSEYCAREALKELEKGDEK